ncbi:MAG: methylenetetrahydrofolate reductase [Nitrospiraceae bacterium]|nr:MAG: methylenetetrahydrofolate reductase [Nitrospiraceae bacterium]
MYDSRRWAVRYEVIPLEGVAGLVKDHVPREIPVTITASPSRGLGPTLQLTEDLAEMGYSVVPHLSARLVHDERELGTILERLNRASIYDALVVAGDVPEPAGPFAGAVDLLRAMRRLGHGLREIGITGYPEGHPLIDHTSVEHAMSVKAEYATYITSQISFNASATREWIERIWAQGIRLPIHIGVPGPVQLTKLLRISARIGLADSVGFLRKYRSRVLQFTRPGRYSANDFLRGLISAFDDPGGKVAGIHVFTFNEIEATERWRRRELSALAGIRRVDGLEGA